MAGEDLNYYYLGHLMAAGARQAHGRRARRRLQPRRRRVLRALRRRGVRARGGAGRAALAARRCGASRCACWRARSAPGSSCVEHGGPLRSYDWFGASRVIEGTINEFPAFSFTLADLHGHVMAIPFSLLALAFGLQVALEGPADGRRGPAALELGLRRDRDRDAVRDQRLVVPRHRRPVRCSARWCGCAARRACASACATLAWGIAVLLLAVLAVLPFLLTYDAAADGLGRVTERASFGSLGARPRRALRAVRLPGGDGLRHPARVLAPPVAHGGAGRAAAAVFAGVAAGRRQPRPRSPGSLALCWVAAHAAFVRPRAGRRALRLGADRRRAAVPADPGGRLRQGLLRRQRRCTA